jgi:hypothetical protein
VDSKFWRRVGIISLSVDMEVVVVVVVIVGVVEAMASDGFYINTGCVVQRSDVPLARPSVARGQPEGPGNVRGLIL